MKSHEDRKKERVSRMRVVRVEGDTPFRIFGRGKEMPDPGPVLRNKKE